MTFKPIFLLINLIYFMKIIRNKPAFSFILTRTQLCHDSNHRVISVRHVWIQYLLFNLWLIFLFSSPHADPSCTSCFLKHGTNCAPSANDLALPGWKLVSFFDSLQRVINPLKSPTGSWPRYCGFIWLSLEHRPSNVSRPQFYRHIELFYIDIELFYMCLEHI